MSDLEVSGRTALPTGLRMAEGRAPAGESGLIPSSVAVAITGIAEGRV